MGLRPVKFDLGKSNDDAVQAYLKDCDCMPCTNPNNAYTFALHVPGKPTFTYYNTIYELKEVTFHTPTEHAMEGQRKAMEVQLHMEKTGCVTCGTQCCTPNNNANEKLKYAILFDEGQSSPSWVTKLASAAVGGITATPDDIAPDLFFRQITVNIQPLMSVYYIYQVRVRVGRNWRPWPCLLWMQCCVCPTRGGLCGLCTVASMHVLPPRSANTHAVLVLVDACYFGADACAGRGRRERRPRRRATPA